MGASGARQIFATLTFCLLAGCGSTQQAAESMRGRWIGQSADVFFAEHGPPLRDYKMGDGAKVYSWETQALPSGTSTKLVCSADIVTDPRNVIVEIKPQKDTIGHWNLSRCTEIFS